MYTKKCIKFSPESSTYKDLADTYKKRHHFYKNIYKKFINTEMCGIVSENQKHKNVYVFGAK